MSQIAKSFQRISNTNNNRKSLSFSKEAAEKIKYDESLILSFLQQKDVPAWFRGTSIFQINGADGLLNALRDDTEQRTSHRVHACLVSIGLIPMVSNKQIRFLMRLSRGNDLAFLWFLMELHYKTPSENGYTVNEQLIMSAMCHLDMITTMRELDKVLPPGHPPLKEIQRMEKQQLEAQLKKSKVRKLRKPTHSLPYYETLVRPKPYGKSLTIRVPDFRVTFGHYENYKNPNYIVHNEANRWYANYDLQLNKRVVNSIIQEEITGMFDDYAAVSLKAETVSTLCEKHKAIKGIEERMEHELRVVVRDRCLKLMGIDEQKKEKKRQRILDQLENDIEKYVCQFKELAECSRRESLSQILSNECCCKRAGVECKCGILDFFEEAVNNELNNVEKVNSTENSKEDVKKNETIKHETRKTSDRQFGMGDTLDGNDSDIPKNDNKELHNSGDSRRATIQSEKKNNRADRLSYLSTASKQRSRISEFATKYCEAYNYGHHLTASPTPSETFFEVPKDNVPYKFDYRKIFRYKYNTEDNLNLKRAFVEALDNDLDLLNKLYEDKRKPTLAELADKCARQMWKEGVRKKTDELQAEEEAQKDKAKSPMEKYKRQYYNPNDRQLMQDMLKDALEHIAENPKFVLASFPEVSKLPLLKEFIYERYGKVYTHEDRCKSFSLSLKIFKALDKVTLNIPAPSPRELGTTLFVDYSCRDYLLKKANFIKRRYYDKLDATIMEQARVFWFTMRPYLCSGGPPRNTYFAYMPSRISDIARFRLWKPTEFINAKREWDRRQTAKNKSY